MTPFPDPERNAIFLGLFHRDRFFIATCPPKQAKQTDNWQDYPFDDVREAAAFCLQWAPTHDVYCGMADFKPGTTRRRQPHVAGCRSIWGDVDVDTENSKAHPTFDHADEAVRALPTSLTPTIALCSGGGIHLHWVLSEPILPDMWADFTGRMLGACAAHGVRIKDTGPSTNIVGVMRPPFTINHKDGRKRPTYVLRTGLAYTETTLRNALQGYEPPHGTWARAAGKVDPDKVKFRRKGGLDPRTFCSQIALSLKEGGANDGYHLWTTNLQVATKLDEPEWSTFIQHISEKHLGYDLTHAEWKASTFAHPPTCARYDHLRPGICPRCPSWGRIASPVALWNWEVVHAPERKRAIDAEIDRFRTAYASALAGSPLKALAEVEHGLVDLKARNPGLARDCAYRLMALIAKWGWPEHTAKSAGIAAGLDEVRAARCARKLALARSAKENAPRPSAG